MGHHRLATPDLGRIFGGESVVGLSEWQLLERYLDRRDEAAFEAIVARHGPMVLGVCRRMLANLTDVEDAFQATFMVLVRRARHLGPRDAIGPWLHGVAARVALRTRCDAARRRRLEPINPDFAAVTLDRSAVDREIAEIIDQELGRLPSKYRHPIVLCYLEGQTHEQAARQLNWPVGTVKGRLSRARELLHSRLARRGLTPSVAALSLALSAETSAALQRELLDRTVRSCLKLAAGQATALIVSTSITSLVEGVVTSMFLNNLKWAGVATLVCGLAFTGVGVLARQDPAPKKDDAPAPLKNAAAAPELKIPAENLPTPNIDAIDQQAKLEELSHTLVKAAKQEWEQATDELTRLNPGPERTYQASKRLMDAQLALRNTPENKVAQAQAHFERVREIARLQHSSLSSRGNLAAREAETAQSTVYAAEASLWLAQAQAGKTEKHKEDGTGEGIKDGRSIDPKSQLVLEKLDQHISMPFADDTALEEVIKHIKQSTANGGYAGIPIYVDPLGLQEAEKSMTSTVRNMDLTGIPLRRTLQLILKQLDLIYFVEDGVLCITSGGSEGRFAPAIHEPSPIKEQAEKAERGELTMKEMEEFVKFLKVRQEVRKLISEPQTSKGPHGGIQ
jgi:RNA polymerase sigma factor (sigma-70 family)